MASYSDEDAAERLSSHHTRLTASRRRLRFGISMRFATPTPSEPAEMLAGTNVGQASSLPASCFFDFQVFLNYVFGKLEAYPTTNSAGSLG
jgi:hypothetical protein